MSKNASSLKLTHQFFSKFQNLLDSKNLVFGISSESNLICSRLIIMQEL